LLTGQESYYFGILRFLSLLGEQWQYNQALREKLTENCIIVVNALSGGLGPDEKIHLIRATAEIDESKLTKEFVSAISTIAVEMTFQQKIKLIEAMKDVNIESYGNIILAINQLSTEFPGAIPADEKVRVVTIIGKIIPTNYENFMVAVNGLSTGMNLRNKLDVMSDVSKIGSADYGIALALGTQIQSLVHRGAAIDRFSYLLPAERALTTARALLFARWIGDAGERGQRMLQVMETRLNDDVPAFGAEFAGAIPYATGVNVHVGDRDKKTERAYDLLLTLWDPTPAEIEHYSAALIAYVRASGNAKAIRALTGEGRTTHDFGGLLQAENERVKTRLAHLWRFVTESVTAIAPGEVELAKQSIVNALADAVEINRDREGRPVLNEDGTHKTHLVCNPGKYQRIATAVLQGRLQGVQIDATPIPAGARLVPVTPEALAQFAPQQPAAAAAPAPERIQAIRNLGDIEEYLRPLTDRWNTMPPANDTALLQQAFEYINNLANGQVPGTDGQHIVLDPRDVVFYLIFGKGVTREGGTLSSTELLYDLNVADYIAQYQPREQQAYVEAKAEAARRALIAEQDARFAQVEAMDRAKQEAEAEAERIKTEAAAKMAEEKAAREEAIQQERKRLESLTPEQRRREMADSYARLAAGSATDITSVAAPAPTSVTSGAAAGSIPAAAEELPLTPDQQRAERLAAIQKRFGHEESKSQ
jgi:hypothetical protein